MLLSLLGEMIMIVFFEHFLRFGAVVNITNLRNQAIGEDYSYQKIDFGMVSESE